MPLSVLAMRGKTIYLLLKNMLFCGWFVGDCAERKKEREREREKHFVEMATCTRCSNRNKKTPTHPVKRTNSSSTEEGDKEEEAELLVADKKSVSSKKSITSP